MEGWWSWLLAAAANVKNVHCTCEQEKEQLFAATTFHFSYFYSVVSFQTAAVHNLRATIGSIQFNSFLFLFQTKFT